MHAAPANVFHPTDGGTFFHHAKGVPVGLMHAASFIVFHSTDEGTFPQDSKVLIWHGRILIGEGTF